jgi:hypothetical protein
MSIFDVNFILLHIWATTFNRENTTHAPTIFVPPKSVGLINVATLSDP